MGPTFLTFYFDIEREINILIMSSTINLACCICRTSSNYAISVIRYNSLVLIQSTRYEQRLSSLRGKCFSHWKIFNQCIEQTVQTFLNDSGAIQENHMNNSCLWHLVLLAWVVYRKKWNLEDRISDKTKDGENNKIQCESKVKLECFFLMAVSCMFEIFAWNFNTKLQAW